MRVDKKAMLGFSSIRALMLLLLMLMACPAEATLQSRVEAALAEAGITGAVWGLDDAATTHTAAAGLADQDRAMQADTRVHVGSIAKAVLATGVLRLASEGRLDLDAPVSELVPDLALDNPWASEAPVRVRHLLDHTAGLDDMRVSQLFSLTATPDMPLAEALDIGRPLSIRTRPGSRYSYSNTGYALLGRVIEEVTGQRYESWLDEALLAPIGMHDSTFAFTTQVGTTADRRLAMGHFDDQRPHPAVAVRVRPAAQFTTTTADMLRFAQFVMGDGQLNGAPFIARELMRQRGRAHATEAARAGLTVGYALGMGLRDRHGAVGLCHGGDTVGFRAMVCAFPEHKRAYFVAFNADVEGADYARIHAMLIESLGVAGNSEVARATPGAGLDAWNGLYVPAPSRFQSFTYVDHLFSVRHVKWTGQALHIRQVQGAPLNLEPAGGNLFRAPGRVLPSHALLIGDDGARVLVDDRQSYARIDLWRVVMLWISFAAGVLGIVYVLLAGGWHMLRRRPWHEDALRFGWWNIVALMVAVVMLQRQPFLQLGDITPASILLALFSGSLPFAIAASLLHSVRTNRRPLELTFLFAILQWSIVIVVCGLLPLRTWVL